MNKKDTYSKPIAITFLVILVFIAFAGVASADGYIQGYVVNESGVGLNGARVIAVEPDSCPPCNITGTNTTFTHPTKGQGWYNITIDLANTSVYHNIMVEPPFGYAGKYPAYEGVNVTDGNTTILPNITLQAAGYIAGWVVNNSGGIDDVTVTADFFNTTTYVHTHGGHNTSYSGGRYNITAPAGTWKLRTFGAPAPYSDNVTVGTVTVAVGQICEQNITLYEAGYIAGWVQNESGTPIPGTLVMAFPPGYTPPPVGENSTNAGGYYNISVPAGTYDMGVHPPTAQYMDNWSVTGVGVTAGQTNVTNFTLYEVPPIGTPFEDPCWDYNQTECAGAIPKSLGCFWDPFSKHPSPDGNCLMSCGGPDVNQSVCSDQAHMMFGCVWDSNMHACYMSGGGPIYVGEQGCAAWDFTNMEQCTNKSKNGGLDCVWSNSTMLCDPPMMGFHSGISQINQSVKLTQDASGMNHHGVMLI